MNRTGWRVDFGGAEALVLTLILFFCAFVFPLCLLLLPLLFLPPPGTQAGLSLASCRAPRPLFPAPVSSRAPPL